MPGSTILIEQGVVQRRDGVAASYIINRTSNEVAVSFEGGASITIDLKSIANYTGVTAQIVDYLHTMVIPLSQSTNDNLSEQRKTPSKSNDNSNVTKHECSCGKWCMCSSCSCG